MPHRKHEVLEIPAGQLGVPSAKIRQQFLKTAGSWPINRRYRLVRTHGTSVFLNKELRPRGKVELMVHERALGTPQPQVWKPTFSRMFAGFESLLEREVLGLYALEIFARLLARSAWCIDHSLGPDRMPVYSIPKRALEHLESVVPNIAGIPWAVALHELDALGWAEDFKYQMRRENKGLTFDTDTGRVNNMTTEVNSSPSSWIVDRSRR
jgi:hypothetical protein